ncbi:uncharacterized protein [Ptychodera flava]|uniref:uncharacterized protein n=1 Tax=Ptychodera flava TaxID=63121 RepID=UPI00396A43BE
MADQDILDDKTLRYFVFGMIAVGAVVFIIIVIISAVVNLTAVMIMAIIIFIALLVGLLYMFYAWVFTTSDNSQRTPPDHPNGAQGQDVVSGTNFSEATASSPGTKESIMISNKQDLTPSSGEPALSPCQVTLQSESVPRAYVNTAYQHHPEDNDENGFSGNPSTVTSIG